MQEIQSVFNYRLEKNYYVLSLFNPFSYIYFFHNFNVILLGNIK